MQSDAVLVLGATGLVGQHVVRRLRSHDRNVVAVSRHPQRDLPGVYWVQADVSEPRQLASLPAASSVISALAIWNTAGALPHLLGHGMSRLIAFSSTSAATKTDASDVQERKLAQRLLDAERLLLDQDGMAATILRPTMIYGGPGDRNVERIATHLRRFRVFPLVDGGRGLRQPVHAEDLAIAAIATLERPMTYGQTYALGGGEILTVRELVDKVAQAHGVRARFLRVPRKPTESAFKAVSRLPGARPIPVGALERMTKDMVFDLTDARREFCYAPRRFEPPNYFDIETGARSTTLGDAR